MHNIFKKAKRFGTLAVIVILVTIVPVQMAKADDSAILTQIFMVTVLILQEINKIPAYLTDITKMAMSFNAADNDSKDPAGDWSQNWQQEQNLFGSIVSDSLSNEANQYTMQKSLITNFFGADNIKANPPVPLNLNDLSYTTLLGTLLVKPDPRPNATPSMNYLMNASGLSLHYNLPGATWRGDLTAQNSYKNFYNAIASVQTYNAFILSRLYQDAQTQSNDMQFRQKLVAQSTNSNWFSSVITNDLGWVLRQILLYNSQIYVLMDQLVQTQKQALAAQAMTNTLLIAQNQNTAFMLETRAKGSISNS